MTEGYLDLKELRVAGILDELSCFCFPYECRFLELDTSGYIEALEDFHPQLLFVESAWHGLQNHWYRKIYQKSLEIREIIAWCNANNVPTVFWNKEDPVHFDTFLGVAGLFDWVYTTDMDCVPLYKRLLKHDRVGVLPFAASSRTFTPLEKYDRKNKICFAGGWYSLQKERCEDFEKIFDLCSDVLGMDIYDRNVYANNPDYTFPEKYRKNIVGSLPMNKIDIAYKGYSCGLTMNTVKYSSTMEARRIYELLACNTVSFSNPCTAIRNLFGDLVIQWENDEKFQEQLNKIHSLPNYKEKLTLAGLRKVMRQHTYTERMNKICQDVLGWKKKDSFSICVFSCISQEGDFNRILRNWKRQEYPSRLVIASDVPLDFPLEDNLTIIRKEELNPFLKNMDCEYYCYFSANNYYGANYLTDMAVATAYSANSVIGKGSYFTKQFGAYLLQGREMSYRYLNRVKCDRCMVKGTILEEYLKVISRNEREFLEDFVVTSIDFFNFCEGEHAASCEIVDDLSLEEGYSIDEIYQICEKLPNQGHYQIQEQFSGAAFLKEAVLGTRKLRKMTFPEGWCGIFSVHEDHRKIYAQVSNGYSVEQYNRDGFIRIFLDGEVRGTIQFILHFLDTEGKLIRKVWHKAGIYLRIPVPENAVTFYYSICVGENSRLLLREVVINAFPENNIPLQEYMGEKNGEI